MHSDIRKYVTLLESSMSVQPTDKEPLTEGRHDDLIKQFLDSAKKRYADHETFMGIINEGESEWITVRKRSVFSTLPNKWKVFLADAVKCWVINEMVHESSEDVDPKTLKKLSTQNRKISSKRSIVSYLNSLAHFASIDHAPLQSFDPMSVDEPFDAMSELEDEWKSLTDELVEPTGEETIVIDLGQYKWFDLGKGACRDEGKAMGHCGNVPSEKFKDIIYSLRQVSDRGGQVYHRPSLTFIANNGILGEMKGRANNKPNAKYHPHIVALLKSKYITGIKGGGYEPEGNFHPDDLTGEQRQEIIDVKGEDFLEVNPLSELKRMVERFKQGEVHINDVVNTANLILEEIEEEDGTKTYPVANSGDTQFMVDLSNFSDEVDSVMEYIEGNIDLDVEVGQNVDELFDDHLTGNQKVMVAGKLLDIWEEDLLDHDIIDSDDDRDTNIDAIINNIESILELELADSLRDAFETAERYTLEETAMNGLVEDANRFIEDLANDYYAIPLKLFEFVENGYELPIKDNDIYGYVHSASVGDIDRQEYDTRFDIQPDFDDYIFTTHLKDTIHEHLDIDISDDKESNE